MNDEEIKINGFEDRNPSLAAVLDSSLDFAIIILDLNGIITGWNEGARRMFGYTKEEAIGLFTDIIFTAEDRAAGIPLVELSRAKELGLAPNERWHIRRDGSKFFMSGVLRPVKENNEITGYVKMTRDVTHKKLTEEAFVLSERQNIISLTSSHIGSWEWNVPDSTITLSPEASVILGLSNETTDLRDYEFRKMIHEADADAFENELKNCLTGLNIFRGTYRIHRRGFKDEIWVNIYGRIIKTTDGSPNKVGGVLYDVTSRKMIERERETFISFASHELKTPASSIKAYAELLNENLAALSDAENVGLITKLHTQVDRLIMLLRRHLDFSIVTEQNLKLQPVAFNLNDLISEVIEELQLLHQTHALVFQPEKIPVVRADKERIRQVIVNFIVNAVKYSPSAKEVIITTIDDMDGARMSVKDFGVGIDEAEKDKIFDAFYRSRDQRNKDTEGSGIGLFLCSQIIKQHHAEIGVDSIKDKGSVFYFKLPYS